MNTENINRGVSFEKHIKKIFLSLELSLYLMILSRSSKIWRDCEFKVLNYEPLSLYALVASCCALLLGKLGYNGNLRLACHSIIKQDPPSSQNLNTEDFFILRIMLKEPHRMFFMKSKSCRKSLDWIFFFWTKLLITFKFLKKNLN